MADALDSGSSGSNPVRVQVPFSAWLKKTGILEKSWVPVFIYLTLKSNPSNTSTQIQNYLLYSLYFKIIRSVITDGKLFTL